MLAVVLGGMGGFQTLIRPGGAMRGLCRKEKAKVRRIHATSDSLSDVEILWTPACGSARPWGNSKRGNGKQFETHWLVFCNSQFFSV